MSIQTFVGAKINKFWQTLQLERMLPTQSHSMLLTLLGLGGVLSARIAWRALFDPLRVQIER